MRTTKTLHPKLEASGISPEVAEARGYREYTPDDVEPVKELFKDWPQAGRAFMTRMAQQGPEKPGEEHMLPGGLVWPRHPVPQAGRVSPRIRPNYYVWTGETDEADEKVWAKYLMFPARTVDVPWEHDHSKMTKESLERHLHKWGPHDGEKIHGHSRRGKDRNDVHGKRLDVHPLALPLLPKAEVVYFVLEGELKADAILTRILRDGLDATVISCPSVTLWQAPELRGFTRRHLLGKLIVLVADSDGTDPTKDVLLHAMSCRAFFRREGVQCVVELPPSPSLEVKIGVDDHLANGGGLDDMVVQDVQPSNPIQVTWEYLSSREQFRSDRATRDWNMLEALGSIADEDGCVKRSVSALASVLGVHHEAVEKALSDLMGLGAVSTTSVTSMADERFVPFSNPAPGGPRGFRKKGLHWKRMPTPTFVIEEVWRPSRRQISHGAWMSER